MHMRSTSGQGIGADGRLLTKFLVVRLMALTAIALFAVTPPHPAIAAGSDNQERMLLTDGLDVTDTSPSRLDEEANACCPSASAIKVTVTCPKQGCPIVTGGGVAPIKGTVTCNGGILPAGSVTITLKNCAGCTISCPGNQYKINCGGYSGGVPLNCKGTCYCGPVSIIIQPIGPGGGNEGKPTTISRTLKKGKIIPVNRSSN